MRTMCVVARLNAGLLCISLAILTGCAVPASHQRGDAVVQGPRGPVLAAPPLGPESRWSKVDAIRTPNHQATVARDLNDGSLLVQLDRVGLTFDAIDPVTHLPFMPERIVDVFDLPTEVVVVLLGRESCGVRYAITFFMRSGGNGRYLGTCGNSYEFSLKQNSIQAVQIGTADPDIFNIANATIVGPFRQSASSASYPTWAAPSQARAAPPPIDTPAQPPSATPSLPARPSVTAPHSSPTISCVERLRYILDQHQESILRLLHPTGKLIGADRATMAQSSFNSGDVVKRISWQDTERTYATTLIFKVIWNNPQMLEVVYVDFDETNYPRHRAFEAAEAAKTALFFAIKRWLRNTNKNVTLQLAAEIVDKQTTAKDAFGKAMQYLANYP